MRNQHASISNKNLAEIARQKQPRWWTKWWTRIGRPGPRRGGFPRFVMALWLSTPGLLFFVLPAHPLFYINESESMPKGIYRAHGGDLKRGDVVVFHAPPEVMTLAVERGYIGAGMPFIKSVGGIAGDTFCVRWDDADGGSKDTALSGRREGLGGIADAKHQGPPNRTGRFIINDVIVGPVFAKDSKGRAMPRIEGCRRVKDGEFLPVGLVSPRSFDGRYWGTVSTGDGSLKH